MTDVEPVQLDMDGVAALLRLKKSTVHRYRRRPTMRFPQPDGRDRAGHPWWWSDRIVAWQGNRHGTGFRSDLGPTGRTQP